MQRCIFNRLHLRYVQTQACRNRPFKSRQECTCTPPRLLQNQRGRYVAFALCENPDGHLKFPHLWPPKLLQVLTLVIGFFGSQNWWRFCYLWVAFFDFFDRLSGKNNASGRRLQVGERWIADAPAQSAGCPQACPVGRSVTHGGRDECLPCPFVVHPCAPITFSLCQSVVLQPAPVGSSWR